MSNVHLNRREFALASLGVAASLTTAGAAEQKPQPEAVEAKRPARDDSDAPPREEDLLLEVIRLRYPHPRLHGKVLAEVRRDLTNDLRRGKLLRSFPLSNSDEPGFTFAAWRSDDIR